MELLKPSTAATVVIGPFVSPGDSVTPLTGLTIQSGRIYKNGTGSAFTPASWAHDSDGFYRVGLSATHTNTIGRLSVQFSDAGKNYLPVWAEFMVPNAIPWLLQYDPAGAEQSPLGDEFGDVGVSDESQDAIKDGIWGITPQDFEGDTILDWLTDSFPVLESGTITTNQGVTPTTTSAQIAPTGGIVTGYFVGAWIKFTGGPYGLRKIATYNDTTKVATWTTPLGDPPTFNTHWKIISRSPQNADDFAFAVLTARANVGAQGGSLEADAAGRFWQYLHMAARGGLLVYDGRAGGGTSTTLTLHADYASARDDAYNGCTATAFDGDSYLAYGVISDYDGASRTCTLSSGSMAGVTGSHWVEIWKPANTLPPTVGSGGGVTLDPDALKGIMIESDVTAHQALGYINAAAWGRLSGQGTDTIVILAGSNLTSPPIRLTVSMDQDTGDRLAVVGNPNS